MELSENYRVVYDSRNVILLFHEMKERNNKETGEKEFYEATKETFHNTLKDALQAFINKSLKGSKSVEECLQRIKKAEERIEELLKKEEIKH